MKTNLKFQAESDAYTLAQYQKILEDKNRMSRAIKAAERQAKDLTERANAMHRVATKSRKK